MLSEGFVVDSPGKVILFGEHAVVHGKLAVATAIDLRTTLTVNASKDDCITLRMQDLRCTACWTLKELSTLFDILVELDDEEQKPKFELLAESGIKEDEKLPEAKLACAAFLALLWEAKFELSPLHCELHSNLPIGAGLGSSAAMSACFAGALIILKTNNMPSPDTMNDINHLAYISEKVVHGTPSGIDNTVSTFGGAIEYSRIDGTSEWHQINNFPKLSFLLVNTCVPRSTKDLVAKVHQRLATLPKIVSPILDAIHQISLQPRYEKWTDNLSLLLSMNHSLLNSLGVGHSSLDKVHELAIKHGFSGMKLTGAGGGGCALINTENATIGPLDALKEDLKMQGFSYYSTSLGACGLRAWRLDKTCK